MPGGRGIAAGSELGMGMGWPSGNSNINNNSSNNNSKRNNNNNNNNKNMSVENNSLRARKMSPLDWALPCSDGSCELQRACSGYGERHAEPPRNTVDITSAF